MSHIQHLINELCPNGVKCIPLETLTRKVSTVRWNSDNEEELPYIDLSSVDKHTHAIGDLVRVNKDTAPSRARQLVRENDILFATTRPTQMRWAWIPAALDGAIASTGYCVIRPNTETVLPRFIAHCLGASKFRQYIENNQVEGNYPSISDRVILKYRIPVPPLEVQREIVRILDGFTKLEAELEAELEARRKQYAFYRDQLLTFTPEGGDNTPRIIRKTGANNHARTVQPTNPSSRKTADFRSSPW